VHNTQALQQPKGHQSCYCQNHNSSVRPLQDAVRRKTAAWQKSSKTGLPQQQLTAARTNGNTTLQRAALQVSALQSKTGSTHSISAQPKNSFTLSEKVAHLKSKRLLHNNCKTLEDVIP